MKRYAYRCPVHGEFVSALQRGATCPVVVRGKPDRVCGKKGIRQFDANVHYHPTKS